MLPSSTAMNKSLTIYSLLYVVAILMLNYGDSGTCSIMMDTYGTNINFRLFPGPSSLYPKTKTNIYINGLIRRRQEGTTRDERQPQPP